MCTHKPLEAIRRRTALILGTLWFCACPRPSLMPTDEAMPTPTALPTLEKAIDLGSLLPKGPREEAALSTDQNDGRLTPGEYVALIGTQFGPTPRIMLEARSMPIARFLKGGAVLVRVPRGVAPGQRKLTLDNGLGTASIEVNVTSFIWAADIAGDALRFRRVAADETKIDEQSIDLEFPQVRYGALSPEGNLLYAVQEPHFANLFTPHIVEAVVNMVKSAEDGPSDVQLRIVDLAAKGGPHFASSLDVTLDSRPTGIAAGADGRVVILERFQLTVVDASDPTHPQVVSRVPLASKTETHEWVDAEFLGDNTRLAVLDAYENQIYLVDVRAPTSPRILGDVRLANPQPEPFSIDLARAPDGISLWVLQGPNLRLAGKKLKDGAGQLWSSAKIGFKSVPGSNDPPTDSLSRLVEVRMKQDSLELTRSVPLPKNVFPFFASVDPRGNVLVSALHGQNPFENLSANLDGVKMLLEGLRDTVQYSRVLSVDPSSGATTTVLQSSAIYYEVTVLPTGRLCASLTRPGPGFIPPRVTLDWGFEIVDGQFVKLREVANTTFGILDAIARLLPPFRYERVGAQ